MGYENIFQKWKWQKEIIYTWSNCLLIFCYTLYRNVKNAIISNNKRLNLVKVNDS